MRKVQKFLSVILCLCMIMTTIGTIAPINASAATIVLDGSTMSGLSFANNDKDGDGEKSVLMTGSVANIGAKAAGDVCYMVEPNDTDDAKFSEHYMNPYKASRAKPYVISYDVLFEGDAEMFWEIWTYNSNPTSDSDKTNTFGIYLSAKNGLSMGKLITNDPDAPKSLAQNQWHNVAIIVPGDGSKILKVYINGEEYECTLPAPAYGTYCTRVHHYSKSYNTYFDNYAYDADGTYDYDAASYVMSDITLAENEKVSYDADTKKFTLLDETLTAGEFKELIQSDYEFEVYSNASYSNALADDEVVPMSAVVVTNNDSKAFRYYDFERTNNSDFEYTVNADGISCTVTGFKEGKGPTAKETAVTIPDVIAGYTVTAIGASAFTGNANFGMVTLPDTLKTIGNKAFEKCYGMDIAKWPRDLEVVGENAFTNAKTNASIAGDFTNTNLKELKNNAFAYSGIKNVVLPNTLEKIGSYAFNWCSIVDIVIPDSVTSMGEKVFVTTYASLKSVRFPRNEKLTKIPAGTISSAYPADSEKLFGSMTLYIPENITEIPNNLLKDFKNGAKVTIYGAKYSAAHEFYKTTKAALDAGEYKNDVGGALAEINFIDYDFENNVANVINESGYNLGDGSTWTQSVGTGCADPIRTFDTVEGGMGKAAGDTAVYFSTIDGSAGHNYKGSEGKVGIYTFELATRAPVTGNYVGASLAYFNTAEHNYNVYTTVTNDIFRLYGSYFSVAGTKTDFPVVAGRWYSIAVTVPTDGSKIANVYINGQKYEVELKDECYGVRHLRAYPNATEANPGETYYDNYRAYSSETRTYNPKHDTPAALVSNSNLVKIKNKSVFLDTETVFTAEELNQILSAEESNIRIYEDETYSKVLTGDEIVTSRAVIVVGSTNGYSFEKVLEYYPVKPFNSSIFDITVLNEDLKTAKVTGFNEENLTATDDLSGISIPEVIAGYTITEIGANAFRENKEIQTVRLPETITKIGSWAFGNIGVSGKAQGNIKSVEIPKNVKEIGSYAFSANPLTSIELPDGLEKLGDHAFYWTSIKELSLPNSLTSIGKNAFRLAPIKYLKLSSGVTEYTQGQFSSSNIDVDELIIPATVTKIGENVFRDTSKDGDTVVDNTSKMTTVVYGAKGSYAEEYASKYGFGFKEVIADTIVAKSNIYGDSSKELAGTDYDLKYGYKNLTYKAKFINIGITDTVLEVKLDLVNKDGEIVSTSGVKEIEVKAGEERDITEEDGIKVDIEKISAGDTTRVTVIKKADGTQVCEPIEYTFSDEKKELHILHIANSFGNDSFSYIRDIAKADDVIFHVQNMYIGGAPLTSHYKNMKQNITAYQPVINTVYGAEKSANVQGELKKDKWDVVALQCASHGFSKDFAFVDFETWKDDANGSMTGTPNITNAEMLTFIRDYVAEYAPDAKRVMHMSWGPCETQSRAMYDSRFADATKYPDASQAVFELQKAAYENAASIYSDKDGQMIPSSIAIQYALNVLGYPEHSGPIDADNKYSKPEAGVISIYRDETCHLTVYGKIIAGLTWYEYLTGNDARENPYQYSSVPAADMAKFKEAAHYANTLVTPFVEKQEEPEEVVSEASVTVSATSGTISVTVNGEDKGEAANTASYALGTTLKFTANNTDENQEFVYWYDEVSKTVVSDTNELEVTVGSDASYVAIYADKTEEIFVMFKATEKIVAAGIKGVIEVPAEPYRAGYKFDAWYVNGERVSSVNLDELSENTTFVAGYILKDTLYNVSASGANEQGGKYQYNTKVTYTPAGQEDKQFAYWMRDGKVVSYSKEYSFYVGADTSVEAVYADEKAEEQIILVMAEPTVAGDNLDKIAFYAERNVPANYTVIESGIILSQAEEFDLSTAGIRKVKAANTENFGQFTVRKANATGQTWNAKAYLIYSDGENVYTMYSNQVTKSL